MKTMTPVIVGIGNPNLDFVVKVFDTSILEKYNLSCDRQAEVPSELLINIKEEVKKRGYDYKYVAGGCVQNTLRIFQWLIKDKFRTMMFGAVGKDPEAQVLEQQVRDTGVITKYTVVDECETSSIVVIVHKDTRTAVAHTGAASKYSLTHLNSDDHYIILNANIILLCGFFAVHSPEIYLHILNNKDRNNIASFNIGGLYVFERQPKIIPHLCEMCDIVIGNKSEFIQLSKYCNITGDDMIDLLKAFHIKMLNNNDRKMNSPYLKDWKKLLIVTDNKRSVSCVYGDGSNIIKYDVIPLQENEIVDTTGAGDSYLAGFLYGLLHNVDLMGCLNMGNRVASEIIKQHGVLIPEKDASEVLGNLIKK